MSALQMNVHCIYITYFRVTEIEIEVVIYLLMIPLPQLAACSQYSYLISSYVPMYGLVK